MSQYDNKNVTLGHGKLKKVHNFKMGESSVLTLDTICTINLKYK